LETQENYAEIIRHLSEHEDGLQNTRLSWFATIQGLLFAGLAIAWKEDGIALISILSLVGTLVAFSTISAMSLSRVAHSQLESWWDENLADYKGPPFVALAL
jgi:predicted permease